MQHDILACLSDIITAITEIYEFLPEDPDFAVFQNDKKTRKAIERNIEIIGEAMDRILKINPELNISNARRIVDTRNRIIHGYDRISEDILWLIIHKYLPILETEAHQLIKELR